MTLPAAIQGIKRQKMTVPTRTTRSASFLGRDPKRQPHLLTPAARGAHVTQITKGFKMKVFTQALGLSLLLGSAAQADDITLRMATIDPSLGAALTMSTFANVVSERLDGVAIEVAPGGAATMHMMEVGRGNLDMSLTGPNIYNLMAAGKAMYANEPDAPELSENLAPLMWFSW